MSHALCYKCHTPYVTNVTQGKFQRTLFRNYVKRSGLLDDGLVHGQIAGVDAAETFLALDE